ncbi:MAG: PAS domain S-box protein [Roseiflexus sp.]|nr:PAS domain S-box protein [Roseiflexus sp.]MCS7289686.1 PAS domain S-box protein [Roseiflexus sp.]MDW8148713.1 PAS domain S-box protein [Roseiflexaceae bacterium]MDW8232384.1 PAS domain S-box protein [Roseiflexaceae bacterium]
MSLITANHETEAELTRLRQRVAELEERLARFEASPGASTTHFEVHRVLDALTVPIFYKDAEGRYVGCNEAFAAFLGRTRAEIIGKTAYDVAPPHLAEVYHQADLALMRQRATQVYEAEVRSAGGESRFVQFSKAPIFDAAGNVVGLVGAIQDITERKRAEQEMARLMEILESTPDVISMADAQGQVVYMNKAGRRLRGLPSGADLAGMRIVDLHPAWAAKIISDEAIPTADRNGYWSGDVAMVNASGEEIPVSQVLLAHHDADGKLTYVTSIMRDISERQRIERALREREIQEQVIEAQRAALRELSTPLLPISSDVVVMPIIGTVDSARAQQIMDSLLQGVSEHNASLAILDITGVKVMDTQVAGALLHAAHAVRLLGAQVVLSGIRPEIAQTLVHIGIDMRDIVTRGTLQQAIAFALERFRQ